MTMLLCDWDDDVDDDDENDDYYYYYHLLPQTFAIIIMKRGTEWRKGGRRTRWSFHNSNRVSVHIRLFITLFLCLVLVPPFTLMK